MCAGKWSHTFNRQQNDPGMVIGDHIGVPVLGFVHLQVGVLPSELLTRVNGLEGRGEKM